MRRGTGRREMCPRTVLSLSLDFNVHSFSIQKRKSMTPFSPWAPVEGAYPCLPNPPSAQTISVNNFYPIIHRPRTLPCDIINDSRLPLTISEIKLFRCRLAA